MKFCALIKVLSFQEYPNPQHFHQKIPFPTEGSYGRIHQPPFPYLNVETILDIISKGSAQTQQLNKYVQMFFVLIEQ